MEGVHGGPTRSVASGSKKLPRGVVWPSALPLPPLSIQSPASCSRHCCTLVSVVLKSRLFVPSYDFANGTREFGSTILGSRIVSMIFF